jgi:hypothetical protein
VLRRLVRRLAVAVAAGAVARLRPAALRRRAALRQRVPAVVVAAADAAA